MENNKNFDFDKVDFNEKSISDILQIFLKCNNQKDANRLLKLYEEYCESPEIARQNLGYIFGYLNEEDRKRLYALFPVDHPFFGHGFGREDDQQITASVLKFAAGGIYKGIDERTRRKRE